MLGVCNWLCALLNELGRKSELLLNEQDRERANRSIAPSEGQYSMQAAHTVQ